MYLECLILKKLFCMWKKCYRKSKRYDCWYTLDRVLNLKDSEWVELTGVIIKGEYKELMPVLKIDSVKKITAPANTYVTTTPKTDTTNTENSTN